MRFGFQVNSVLCNVQDRKARLYTLYALKREVLNLLLWLYIERFTYVYMHLPCSKYTIRRDGMDRVLQVKI